MAGAYDTEETVHTRKQVAGWLAHRRATLGTPRVVVAQRMEIDQADLGKLERGGPNFTWSRLYRWCKANGVRIELVAIDDGSDETADYEPRFRTETRK